jgi:ureidoglycolate hydrolase
MTVNESLIEIREYLGDGYQPLVDFESWRVAILRYHEELLPQNIAEMQRHNETDEVFVLLAGRCILFVGEGAAELTSLEAVELEPQKLFNVKQGTWHTHTLSEDAVVLVVENRDTTLANSPRLPLSPAQQEKIVKLTRQTWG